MGSTGIQWSGTSGHLRIGIDVRWDDYNTDTTAIQVWVDYYVQTQAWGYNDGQSLNISGSIAHRHDYTLSSPSGQTVTHFLYTYAIGYQGLSYGGGPTYTFAGSISGAYDGSAPSLSINWTLPARPANVPTAPPTSVDSVTSSSARIVVSAADPRGSGIVEYQVLVGTNAGDIIGSQVRNFSGGTGTVTGLNSATTYHAVSRARNGVGWGPWSSTASFTTGASVPGTPTGIGNNSVGQTGANITFTAPSNGGSAITNYTLQIATDSSFTQNVATGTHAGSPIALGGLTPGTTYWARVRANNAVGSGSYSSATSFSTLAGTPTLAAPTEGQTKATNAARPYALVGVAGVTAGQTITAQFSKDSTFATGVITVTLSPSGKSADDQYELLDNSQYLSNGTWYVRAQTSTASPAYTSPWSATRSFVEAHTPSASAVSPTAGATIQYAPTVAFFWRFNDIGVNEGQTAYRLVIENNVTGASVYDSNKTALVGNTTDPIGVSVAIATTLKSTQLRWRVMVWDKGDQASAWTGYSLFMLADPPVSTIVTPAPSLPVDNGAPTFSWTNNIPSGGTQASAVVKVYDQLTGELVWTGTVAGSRTNVSPDVVILTNARTYNYTLDVTDSTGLTGSTSGSFTTSYSAPPSIAYSVTASDPDETGYVSIAWPDANPDDTFVAWKVYRRDALEAGSAWQLIETISDQNVREYRDYLLNGGATYSYSVTQTATRSGVVLESSVGYTLTGADVEVTETRTFTIELTQYWLINPDNQDQSVMLPNVTSDSSTLEFESETYTIIGRGRHRDYGDELGYSGTLTCQVQQPERQSSFRLKMEALRRSNETYYLRTPFGRMFKVALGNLGWTPTPGTGIMEMGEMSIPYEEVA